MLLKVSLGNSKTFDVCLSVYLVIVKQLFRFEFAVKLGLGLGLELKLGLFNFISLFLSFFAFSEVNQLAKSDL